MAVEKKKSGAKHKTYKPKKGVNSGMNQYFTWGWQVHKGCLFKFSCVSTNKSKESDKGWLGNIACTVVNVDLRSKEIFFGTMQKSTGKVVIDELAIVLNPDAKNDGYTGTWIDPDKKKRK